MTIYYVDKTLGDDSWSGEHGTQQNGDGPWETINKVNISSFNAGDSILFKRDEVWREQLDPPNTGTDGNQITFGAYGSGDNPLILASTDADSTGSWSRYDSQNVVFESYAETGDMSEWDAVVETGGTMAASSTEVNIGTYSIKMDFTGDGGTRAREADAYANQTEIYLRFFINFDATSFSSGDTPLIVQGLSDADGNELRLSMHLLGATYYLFMTVYEDGGALHIPGYEEAGWACASIMDGAWHEIKIHYKVATGEGADDGIGEFWVDGTSRGSNTGVDNDTKAGIGKHDIGIATLGAGRTATWYWDDIVVASSDIVGIIWKTANSSYTTDPFHVVYDTDTSPPTWCAEEANYADLSANWEWWYDTGNDFVAIYQDANNPATEATGLEIPTRSYGINIAGDKDYITIDGIDTRYAISRGILYRLGATNGIATNLDASYNGVAGISFTEANDDFLIDTCTASYNGKYNGEIYNNTNGGTIKDSEFSYSGAVTTVQAHNLIVHVSTNILIQNNHIHHTCSGADGSGIGGDEGTSCIYEYNEIHDIDRAGIDLSGLTGTPSEGNIIRYNLIYNHTGGVAWQGSILIHSGTSQTDACKNNEVYYNIIYGGYVGIYFTGDVNGNNVYNNVIYDCLYGVYFDTKDSVSPSTNTFKNNIVHTASEKLIIANSGLFGDNVSDYNFFYDASLTDKFQYGSNNYSNIADWRTGTSQDANSDDADPLFVDASNDDFKLQSGSPCLNAGTHVSYIGINSATSVAGALTVTT